MAQTHAEKGRDLWVSHASVLRVGSFRPVVLLPRAQSAVTLAMRARPYRIYLRGSPLPFLVTLSVLCMAFLFTLAIFTTPGASRFGLIFPTVVLFLLAYSVHKASLSWIRISADGKEIASIPSWFARKLLGEARAAMRVVPGSELIFCRRLAYGGLDGYYIIVRAPDGSEQVIWNDVTGVSRRRWSRIANDIREYQQFRARLVSQTISAQGVEETEWTAETDKAKWKIFRVAIGPALSPWLGIAVRVITANPTAIVLTGVLLWLIGSGAFLYIYRTQPVSKEQSSVAAILLWTFQFTLLYAATVLITGTVMHH